MKQLRYLFSILLSSALLLSSCSDEVSLGDGWFPSLFPRQLSLSSYDIRLPSDGGASSVSVAASGTSWRIEGDDAPWLTLAPKNGERDATVTLMAAPNADPTTGRSVAYALASADAGWAFQRPFSVSQDAAGYSVRPSAKTFTKSAARQEFEVAVTANAEWSAASDQSWLTLRQGDGSVTLQLAANTTSLSADRIAHVTLSCGPATEIITVNQQPPSVTVAQDELLYGPDEEVKTLEVKSDVPWSAACSQSWVTLSPEEGGAGSTLMLVRAAENASVSERTANVYVKIGSETLHSIPLHQQGKSISASPASLPAFPPAGGSQTVTVTSNTAWTAYDVPPFVTLSPDNGGSGVTAVTVTASSNGGNQVLSGDLLFGHPGVSGFQAKVHVEQDCGALGLSEQTVTVGSTSGSRHALSLTSDQPWTASFQSGTWAHVSPASGEGSATLTLTADDNPSTREREDILTITPAVTKTPLTFRFVQQGKTLEVSTTELTISPAGGASDPLVVTTDGTYEVSQSGSWFTVEQSGNTVLVRAAANDSGEPRTGSLTVSLTQLAADEYLSQTVAVRQYHQGEILAEGFGEDKNWNAGTSHIAGVITAGGFSADKNWNHGGMNGAIAGGGFSDDKNWNHGSGTNGTITAGGFSDDKNWNHGSGTNGTISGGGFSDEDDWDFYGEENGHEWVDLGLLSGLKWATMNVGAVKPEGYGDYFAWGETQPKSTYNWSTYFDSVSSKKYNNNGGKTTLDPEDDAAHVNWGGAWRMPTLDEIKELHSNCTWTWTTQSGVKGCKVVGPNGNSLFLPAAGYRNEDNLSNAGSNGGYWSSSLVESDSYYAYNLNFNSGYVNWYGYSYRGYGFSVRPVCQ